jgi:hypothetical protein
MKGAGWLFRAPVGSLLPGQVEVTVTNKALASNEVTLTTGSAHGIGVGKDVIIDIDDAVFDGLYTTITGTTGSTIKYAKVAANVSSTSATGTARSWDAGGTVANSVFTDDWPAAWTLWGVTREGSQFTWTPSTDNIEVAEELLPVEIVTTGIESAVEFEVVQFTLANFAAAVNGGSTRTVSGTGATTLSELVLPVIGAETRSMIGWESADHTERAVYMKCFQTGDLAIARRKGADNAGLSMTWSLEQPAIGQAFREFTAGVTPVAG